MTDKEVLQKPVTHCIFDMDGLLLDTETLYTEVFSRIVSPYGMKYTWEHKARIMGFRTPEVAEGIIKMLNLPMTPAEFEAQAKVLYAELFPRTQMMPGAERLLRHLKTHNVPIALATSSSAESYNLKTKNYQHIFDLFDHQVLGGSDPEVRRGKPCPDIFIVAAARFPDQPDPSKCLVFEDAPNGVQAACAAGMRSVMVPDPNLPKSSQGDATIVFNSLNDFKPELFGLPPFED
ncbi:pseudouridine-5'-phosphatase [Athalia rosae]|uniref:pseudouridine-5'-phosphatase n=1 Tax=Athalia rosae TaxID=37344 RepID=UPI002033ABF7|nr:pseudouridine-5'-phosphatase [Athalia rosae]